jgi:glutamate-1-semialdehyde 2,1-aminomutase
MTDDGMTAAPRALCFERSRELMAEARQWLAGGVSSNFRLGISPTPLVIERAEGAFVFDADGNRLIDYYLGMGPMMLGHNPASVRNAVAAQLARGILYAGQSESEFAAARMVCRMVPCAERIRFTSSASEAAQGAIRLARAATGRSRIVKFEGHYHGWFDNVLWSVAPALDAAGAPDRPVPVAGSRGQISDGSVDVLPWNDLPLLAERLASGQIAAVIMEPAMCNAGAIEPAAGYLEGAREACARAGSVLIFDETITGFRLAPGGAQQRFGVTPDLAVFGKAIANGFPVAAIAGRADLLDQFAHGVVHGGTYNAQPLGMAATLATLRELADPAVYAGIAQRGARLMDGVRRALRDSGLVASVGGFPEVFHVGFGLGEPARNFRDLARIDRARYVAFTTALLRRGVRALERGAWFLSAAHDDSVVDETLAAVAAAAREVAA